MLKGKIFEKKRIASILLALCMVLALLPGTARAEDQGGETVLVATATPTGIQASSVTNTGGYASVSLTERGDDFFRNRLALVNSAGNFIIQYFNSSLSYYYSDGILSKYASFGDGNEAVIYSDDQPGYYNLDGTFALNTDYDVIQPFFNGVSLARKYHHETDGNSYVDYYYFDTYLINKQGATILSLPAYFGYVDSFGSGGDYVFTEQFSLAGGTGWYSEGLLGFSSCVQVESNISDHADWTEEQINANRITDGKTSGYMDINGNVIISQQYSNVYPFSEGLACVVGPGGTNVGFIDKSGNTAIPFAYDEYGTNFSDGLAAVGRNGKMGYINAQNEVIIPFEYDTALSASDGICPVAKSGRYGLIDYSGNVVLPLEYDDISEYINGVAYAIKDRQLYIITIEEGQQPTPPVEPVVPVEPVEPEQPITPSLPPVPDTSVWPTNPATPSKPSTPEESKTPEQPAEPEQPVQPETPQLPATPAPAYRDVPPTTWYSEAASYVSARGLMTGTSAAEFSPTANMTRAMVWTVLGRLDGADVSGGISAWYEKAQEWSRAKGISDGSNPNGSVTREELATMLWRYMGSPAASADLSRFSDSASVSGWASAAVQWAVSAGLLEGSDGNLNPSATATRAEVAAILMRFCENVVK